MIEYRFRVPSAAVFTLYLYSKALKYPFRVTTAGSLIIESLSNPCLVSIAAQEQIASRALEQQAYKPIAMRDRILLRPPY
jgi:hypothetical protein